MPSQVSLRETDQHVGYQVVKIIWRFVQISSTEQYRD